MTPNRILVVDDSPMNIELATHVLEDAGFVVAWAGGAAAAFEQVTAFQPELILMDIQMPGIDGLTLSRRLKADPSTWRIVIIAYTAYAMKGDEAKMRAAGCDGYISKPIDVATFATQVRAHLGTAVSRA